MFIKYTSVLNLVGLSRCCRNIEPIVREAFTQDAFTGADSKAFDINTRHDGVAPWYHRTCPQQSESAVLLTGCEIPLRIRVLEKMTSCYPYDLFLGILRQVKEKGKV